MTFTLFENHSSLVVDCSESFLVGALVKLECEEFFF